MAHQQPRFSVHQRRFGLMPRIPFVPSMPGNQNHNRFQAPPAQNPPVEKRKLPPRAQNENRGGKKKKNQPNEKLDKIHKDLKEILSKVQNDNGIIALMKYIQPTQQETYEILDKVTDDLRNVLSRCFPYFDIHPFGSAVTGLLLKGKSPTLILLRGRSNLKAILKKILERRKFQSIPDKRFYWHLLKITNLTVIWVSKGKYLR